MVKRPARSYDLAKLGDLTRLWCSRRRSLLRCRWRGGPWTAPNEINHVLNSPFIFDVDDEAQSVAAALRSHLGLETPTRQRQENSSPSTKYAFGDAQGHPLV